LKKSCALKRNHVQHSRTKMPMMYASCAHQSLSRTHIKRSSSNKQPPTSASWN